MKTPHTVKIITSEGAPKFNPVTGKHDAVKETSYVVPAFVNYISQSREFELYGSKTNRMIIVRFNQEQPPFEKLEFDGRSFKPMDRIDAPIKGAVRLKEVHR